ncbi:polysaccharide deacetylase family protein [Actinomadura logoneensis]|uniref:Polysaccharide deacetylase family protein n=1 Tax=Actinomadura logoneensis TaxID=2293572 RepID=A0A372JSB6_9ACTN|nr:polysaccharide deacetylase family protein [Actinomadura logoneensis]
MRRGAAAVLAAGLLLGAAAAGCGTSGAGTRQAASDPTLPNAVDPATVAGLETVTRTESDARRRLFTAYPVVPGAGPLTARLARAVADLTEPYERETGTDRGPPGALVPELNLQWTLTAASANVVGVRLASWKSQGAGAGETRRTYWYDGRAGRAVGSSALVRGEYGLGRLADRVRARIGAKADPRRVTADAATFASMAFNEDGDLVVEFSDHSVAPDAPGRVAVALSASEFEPLLSDLGRRARAASLAARPGLALGPETTGPETTGPETTGPETTGPDATGGRLPGEGARTPSGRVDCAVARCVALTFDDGPGPDTPRLLDELARADVRATFFVVGSSASARPEVLRRAVREGHEIGDHTRDHRDLTRLTPIQVHTELQQTQDAVRKITGRAPALLRPPYGASNGVVADVARSLGLVQSPGTVDTLDWRDRDASAVAARAVAGARPGAVIVMRDVFGPTVDAVPRIAARLKAEGYTLVTVSELLAAGRPGAGDRAAGR